MQTVRDEAGARTRPGGRPLRVLLVTPRYLPLTGGVETHVREISRRMRRAGLDVVVLTTDQTARLPAREELDGVPVVRVRAWPARGDYRFAPGVFRFVRTGGWDLVHVQSYHTFVAPLAMAAALAGSIPYVVTFHGGGHSSRLRHALRSVQLRLLRPLLMRSDRLIAVARFELARYGEQLGIPLDRFLLVPNGADLPRPVRADASQDGAPLIASVGRLERYKGHHHLISALPSILEHQPDARVWLAGSGPYEATLRRLAERLGVSDRVRISAVPANDREAMASELSQASVVVLLSEFETHPVAALEAAALGRPVIVADNSGLRELADRGLARAVSGWTDPQRVADAVLETLRGKEAPPMPDLPTWDDCADRLIDLYEETQRARTCAS